jgi:predicted N-acetyltransferase YhbS
MENLIIKNGCPENYKDAEFAAREAFWNLYRPGCDEHYTAHRIWEHQDFLPELFYVALHNNKLVGFIVYTKSYLKGKSNPARIETVTFGPVCILPEYQHQGIGTKLIQTSMKEVDNFNYPAIVILGDPHNYCRHGFRNCKDYNISARDGKYPLGQLVHIFDENIIKNGSWEYFYSDVYNINLEEVEKFEQNFSMKEKKHQHSQDLFKMMIRAYIE